ncbi:hypothetical protein BDZ91DRAFT_723479 [Kalaharituber pfeilii]|nr:hypothetical protein BDZ91DRAFT_723479 [Kalaharituber pfeilii]
MATQMQVYHDAPASNPHQLPPRSSSLSSSTSSLQAQLKRKDHDLNALHLQRTQQENELVSLRKQVKGLQDFIIQSRNKVQALEGIIDYDDVYFEREYKQLAAAVKDWCWKLSRGAGIFVGSKDDREKVQGRAGDEHEPPFLSREEIERLMKTHSKIGVTTAFVVDRIWYGCWSRYAPGLTEEEELILKQFEDDMRRSDKIPMASINRWRATTLSLLTKFPKYTEGVSMQAATLVTDICQTLSRLLVTPSTTNDQRPTTADERSLTRILEKAMTLYAQMRGQRSRFELVFPSKGDRYDCRMMEDSSDILVYDEEDLMGGTVGAVAFPGVIKYGEEQEIDRIPAKDTSDRPTAASPVPAGAAAENVKPRVLVKARVLCIVPDE